VIVRNHQRVRVHFRESEEKVRGGGVIETKFGSFEGSQAVPASPSGRGEACIRDLLNFEL
jgi:hypothetical protein